MSEGFNATQREIEILEARKEIERLRAIVRVNGLRWGHTHAEIDAILANSPALRALEGE